MRAIVLALHRWVGLGAGLLFALLGLTGSLLVIGDSVDAQLAPELRRVAPAGERASASRIVASVQAAQGGVLPRVLQFPEAADATVEAWTDAAGTTRLYVDPYSARVLGARDATDGLIGFVRVLHIRLAAGEAGHLVVGVLGLVLVALVAAGVWLWWPRWRKLSVGLRLRQPVRGVRGAYDSHKLIGLGGMVLLIVAAVTGSALVFHEAAAWVVRAPKPAKLPAVSPRGEALSLARLDALLAEADRALPGARTFRVHLPGSAGEPLRVRKRFPTELHPNGMSFVVLDPADGRVLSVTDARAASLPEWLLHLRYPLHTGVALGAPGRILVALSGLVPGALFVTGLLLWRARRRAARPLTPTAPR